MATVSDIIIEQPQHQPPLLGVPPELVLDNEQEELRRKQDEVCRQVEEELYKSSTKHSRPTLTVSKRGSVRIFHTTAPTTPLSKQQQQLHPRGLPVTRNARLANLIKALWSTDATIVSTALWQIQDLLEQGQTRGRIVQESKHGGGFGSSSGDEEGLQDNTFELAVVRRGGHLAILHALEHHPQVEAIQAIGLSMLAGLCERCNVKSMLFAKGALALTTDMIIQYTGVSALVVTEAYYLLGHLGTLPKVADHIAAQKSLVPAMLAALDVWPADDAIVDGMFFWVQRVSSHRTPAVVDALWQGECLSLIVKYMQHAVVEWEALREGTRHIANITNNKGNLMHEASSMEALEDRLDNGCKIFMLWAKTADGRTTSPPRARIMTEAGALTLTAELLRLFPAGAELMKAAHSCLRAMVPAIPQHQQ